MKKKKKGSHKILLLYLILLIGGGLLGWIGSELGLFDRLLSGTPTQVMLSFLVLFVSLLVANLLHVIIHEGGHLCLGLLTGYRFVSFRVGPVMLIRKHSKLRWARYALAGTAGQCLMSPPSLEGGRFPMMLYNLGGSLFNLIFAALSIALWALVGRATFWEPFLLLSGLIGLFYAVVNGLPLRIGGISTDGRNAFFLRKDPVAMHGLWLQLRVNALQADDVRLRDMPGEWFDLLEGADCGNPLVASIAVLQCNRQTDLHDFEKAQAESRKLVSLPTLLPIYRLELQSDLLYYELISTCKQAALERLATPDLLKYLTNKSTLPNHERTLYAYALLANNDPDEAALHRKAIDQMARHYPYCGELEGERELLAIADSVYASRSVSE